MGEMSIEGNQAPYGCSLASSAELERESLGTLLNRSSATRRSELSLSIFAASVDVHRGDDTGNPAFGEKKSWWLKIISV